MRKIAQLAAALAAVLLTFAGCGAIFGSDTPAPARVSTPVGSPAVPVLADDSPRNFGGVSLQPARKITAREWQRIAKDPDAHTGERVIVYGQVTQFDAATSTTGFRANVDGIEHKPEYGYADYETNTWMAGEAALLSDVVHGDLFRAEVTVAGTLSYDAAIGGTRNVPAMLVTKIDVIGQVS